MKRQLISLVHSIRGGVRRCLMAVGLLGMVAAHAALADTTLLVIGDTGDCGEGPPRVAAALRAQPDWRSAWLLEVGDLAYPAGTLARLKECHEPHFGDFPNRLAIPGNHDWRDPGAAGFFTLFPQAVPRAQDLPGPWRLLLLDSNLRGDAWQLQVQWLDAALVDAGKRCLIAAWHHPRWSSGSHGDNVFTAALWQRLAGRATLTLHGHDHHFEALPPLDGSGLDSPTGTASFVVGHGGATLYPAGNRRASLAAVFGQWGFLRLDLGERGYRWRAYDVEGGVLAEGRGECRQP